MLSDLLFRLRAMFRRASMEEELDEELRTHLEHQAKKYIRLGLTREDAMRRARLEFGGLDQVKEECRDARGVHFIETLFQDARYASRLLRKNPGFTATAVLTLALGIGATTAIFSVVHAIILRPLPYRDSDRLLMVWEKVRLPFYQNDQNEPAPGNFADWKGQNTVFEDLAASMDRSFNLTGEGEPLHVEGDAVSANLFSLLRVEAAIGRVFNADEDRPGGPRVALMGYDLWTSRFGRDPAVVGKSILLDRVSYRVIGVMPRGFIFPDHYDYQLAGAVDQLWVPLALSPADLANHGSHYLHVIARLKPRVTIGEARAEMGVIARRLEQEHPNSNSGVGVNLLPLRDEIVGNVRPALLILSGAAALIFLMVCGNIANLLLARASTRHREMGIRAALGASPGRIFGQLLSESTLLALLGGALGLLLSEGGVGALRRLSPPDLPRIGEINVNAPVLLFSAGISLMAALLFGIAPALNAHGSSIQNTLGEGVRHSASSSRLRARSLLIVAEAALCIMVLVGAGLLLRSFLLLERAPLGFEPRGLLTFRVIPRGENYLGTSERALFYQQALARIQAVPGAEEAAAVSFIPLTLFRASKGFSIDGRVPPGPGQIPFAGNSVVSPGYFGTMGIPLLEGRDFSWSDTAHTRRVIVINEAMAKAYWPNEDPINRRINEGLPEEPAPWETVVGVVGDIRTYDAATPPQPEMYFPISQFDGPNGILRDWAVRTAGAPLAIAPGVREAIWSLDKGLPVSRVQTMDQVRSASVASRRFNFLLLALFACLALALATGGLYGVTAYSVAQRTQEIGVRRALGARPSDIVRLVVGRTFNLTLMGAAIGIGGALVLTPFVSSLLYGVRPTDPLTFVAVSLLLLAVAVVASYIPARRATKVDPMLALRCE